VARICPKFTTKSSLAGKSDLRRIRREDEGCPKEQHQWERMTCHDTGVVDNNIKRYFLMCKRDQILRRRWKINPPVGKRGVKTRQKIDPAAYVL
jgi:hypothetical protein